MSLRRIPLITAVGASLAGGAVAGALLFTPAISGAQTDDAPSTTEESAEVPDAEHCHGPRGHRIEGLADLMGWDADELKAALQDGQTIVEFAETQGVTEDALVDAIVAQRSDKIDDAVADGRLTEEEAAELKEGLEERVTSFVNGERPDGPPFGRRHRPGPPPWAA